MRLIPLGNYPWQTKPVNCPQVNSYCSHWVNSHLIKFPLGKLPPGEFQPGDFPPRELHPVNFLLGKKMNKNYELRNDQLLQMYFVFANGIFLASLEVLIFANYPM